MCEHKSWQISYDDTTKLFTFKCLEENIVLEISDPENAKLMRQRAASLMGKVGGQMLKDSKDSAYYSDNGKKGMASRWGNRDKA